MVGIRSWIPSPPVPFLRFSGHHTIPTAKLGAERSGRVRRCRGRASNDADVSTSCLPDPIEHLAQPTGTFALGLSSESVILLVAGYNYGGNLAISTGRPFTGWNVNLLGTPPKMAADSNASTAISFSQRRPQGVRKSSYDRHSERSEESLVVQDKISREILRAKTELKNDATSHLPAGF